MTIPSNHVCFPAEIVTTGSEASTGRIKDKFGPVVSRKFENCVGRILGQRFVPDSDGLIVDAFGQFWGGGTELICPTGGMSIRSR
ncbi:MAG: molybdopterin-binding protein [Syntrophobacteraceae bacterium]